MRAQRPPTVNTRALGPQPPPFGASFACQLPRNCGKYRRPSHSRHQFRPLWRELPFAERLSRRPQTQRLGNENNRHRRAPSSGGRCLAGERLDPRIIIGGVAVLAPRYLPRGALRSLRRRTTARGTMSAPQRRAAPDAARQPSTKASRKTSRRNSPSARPWRRPSPSALS